MYKSASFYLGQFVRYNLKVGDEFTRDYFMQLVKDDKDCPALVTEGAINGFLSKQHNKGVFKMTKIEGQRAAVYKLLDPDLIKVKNRRSIGSAPGRQSGGPKDYDERVTPPGNPPPPLPVLSDQDYDTAMSIQLWHGVPMKDQRILFSVYATLKAPLNAVSTEDLWVELRRRVK